MVEPVRRHYVKRHLHHQDGPILVRDFDGDLAMRLDRTSYMGSLIYWRGYHALMELKCLERCLKPEMVFADVGANHGEFTTFAAKRLQQGRVLAFEPLEENYRQLCENVRLNGFSNVTTYPIGLADVQREVELYSSNDHYAHGGWNEGLATVFRTSYCSSPVGKVYLKVFDDLFGERNLKRLDGMKIDVEGSELPVLKGAIRTIERFRPFLILEMNEESFTAAGYSAIDIAQLLQPLGYVPYRIGRGGRQARLELTQLPRFCNTIWLC